MIEFSVIFLCFVLVLSWVVFYGIQKKTKESKMIFIVKPDHMIVMGARSHIVFDIDCREGSYPIGPSIKMPVVRYKL